MSSLAHHTACCSEAHLDKEDVLTPRPIALLPSWGRVVSIAAGAYSSALLTKTGRAALWGLNATGQLGIGSTSLQEQV